MKDKFKYRTTLERGTTICIICNVVPTMWDDGICTFCVNGCPDHIPHQQITRWLLEHKQSLERSVV